MAVLLCSCLRPFPGKAQVAPVGYVNVELPQGYSLISNPLSMEDNQIATVVRSAPPGTQFIKFYRGEWWTNEFDCISWVFPEMTLSPGEGTLVYSPARWRLTWVGGIAAGSVKVFVPRGVSLRASIVPQAGSLSTRLEFPRINGTKIYKVDQGGAWQLQATCVEQAWEPSEPVLTTGEAFYVEAPEDFVWSRDFAAAPGGPLPATISVARQPESQKVELGGTISLSAEGVSSNAFRYQWQFNGNDIPGASAAALTISNVAREDLGSYWVKVWDDFTGSWSDIATVQLTDPSLAIEWNAATDGIQVWSAGVAGREAAVEYSSDLLHWSELSAPQKQKGGSVIDATTREAGMRFYRLRVE